MLIMLTVELGRGSQKFSATLEIHDQQKLPFVGMGKEGCEMERFTIKAKGLLISIETEYKKPEAYRAVLGAIFYHYRKAKPESLDRLLSTFNHLYDSMLKEEAINAAKKAGTTLPDKEPERDDFDFWKQLMESIPGGGFS